MSRLACDRRRLGTSLLTWLTLGSFGTWKIPRDTAATTVYNAIKAGYRLLDSAGDYGNEKESGQGLKRALDEGIVKREEICECGEGGG